MDLSPEHTVPPRLSIFEIKGLHFAFCPLDGVRFWWKNSRKTVFHRVVYKEERCYQTDLYGSQVQQPFNKRGRFETGCFGLWKKEKIAFECQNRVMVAVPGFLKCEIIVGSLLDPLSTALKCKLFYPTQFCNYQGNNNNFISFLSSATQFVLQ